MKGLHINKWLLVFLMVALPLALTTISKLFFETPPTWVEIPSHSALEAIGGVLAILMAIVLLAAPEEDRNKGTLCMAYGLLGMGILDTVHAFINPGELFVWTHSLATAVGGLLVAGVWLPVDLRDWTVAHKGAVIVASLAAAASILSIVSPGILPGMLEHGQFTTAAVVLNVGGGILFLAGATYYFMQPDERIASPIFCLGTLSLILGISGILFKLSAAWELEWWLWHIVRMSAFIIALLFIIYRYVFTVKAVETSKETEELLAKSLAQQTVIENQEATSRARLELVKLMQGEQDIKGLAQKAMDYIAPFVGAQVGALYILQGDEKLAFTAGYAYKTSSDLDELIPLGQGLLGQAAQEGKLKLQEDVPANYIKVYSGMFEKQPEQIIFSPLKIGDKLLGIIELGSVDTFSKEAVSFLEQASESIAASIGVVYSWGALATTDKTA